MNFDLKWPLGIERVKAIGLRLSFYFNISRLFNVILSHAFWGAEFLLKKPKED